NYLSTLGVALSRISVVSYGKERPDALGSDETAWQKNRRAVTVTVR
ncbi:peptidoglycan-associated lipoprotein, partial [Sphingopyxis sp. BSNA05]|nr:peptidoglycan-associated lipoprotein [Sphingopyxis sp. BSNA05]